MTIKPQNVFDHRSRAFERVRSQVDQHDPRGSVLASIFAAAPAASPRTVSPDQLTQLVRWVVDEVGGLCPSDERLLDYANGGERSQTSDVCYHVWDCHWSLDAQRLGAPGCQLCQSGIENKVASE